MIYFIVNFLIKMDHKRIKDIVLAATKYHIKYGHNFVRVVLKEDDVVDFNLIREEINAELTAQNVGIFKKMNDQSDVAPGLVKYSCILYEKSDIHYKLLEKELEHFQKTLVHLVENNLVVKYEGNEWYDLVTGKIMRIIVSIEDGYDMNFIKTRILSNYPHIAVLEHEKVKVTYLGGIPYKTYKAELELYQCAEYLVE